MGRERILRARPGPPFGEVDASFDRGVAHSLRVAAGDVDKEAVRGTDGDVHVFSITAPVDGQQRRRSVFMRRDGETLAVTAQEHKQRGRIQLRMFHARTGGTVQSTPCVEGWWPWGQ